MGRRPLREFFASSYASPFTEIHGRPQRDRPYRPPIAWGKALYATAHQSLAAQRLYGIPNRSFLPCQPSHNVSAQARTSRPCSKKHGGWVHTIRTISSPLRLREDCAISDAPEARRTGNANKARSPRWIIPCSPMRNWRSH